MYYVYVAFFLWLLVQSHFVGSIQTTRAHIEPPFDAEIDASMLNVRKGPGMRFSVVNTLPRGTPVRLVRTDVIDRGSGSDETWSQISVEVDGETLLGWVCDRFLTAYTPVLENQPVIDEDEEAAAAIELADEATVTDENGVEEGPAQNGTGAIALANGATVSDDDIVEEAPEEPRDTAVIGEGAAGAITETDTDVGEAETETEEPAEAEAFPEVASSGIEEIENELFATDVQQAAPALPGVEPSRTEAAFGPVRRIDEPLPRSAEPSRVATPVQRLVILSPRLDTTAPDEPIEEAPVEETTEEETAVEEMPVVEPEVEEPPVEDPVPQGPLVFSAESLTCNQGYFFGGLESCIAEVLVDVAIPDELAAVAAANVGVTCDVTFTYRTNGAPTETSESVSEEIRVPLSDGLGSAVLEARIDFQFRVANVSSVSVTGALCQFVE